MNCPICGEEMERGFLYGRKDAGLPWYPGNEKPPIYFTENMVAKRNGLILGKEGIFLENTLSVKNAKLETFICRKCRKGVFSY